MTGSKIAKVLGGLCAASLCLALLGCGQSAQPAPQPSDDSQASEAAQSTQVRVASLKGPTSIGLVDLMEDAKAGTSANSYSFDIVGTPDEVVQKVVNGDVDIALVPANVASVLYNKTDGKVQAIDINTLSTLSVVSANSQVKDFSDLAGKTVYLTGKGASPQYVVEYLLSQAGIADSVTLEYKSEASEAVAALAQDPTAAAVLPQPFATAARSKVEGAATVADLGDVWKQYAPQGSQLVTGVTIVSADFLANHPEAVQTFVKEQEASVKSVLADPQAAASLVVSYGIIDNESVAAKAIPSCGLACVTGQDMESALEGYLSVLFEANPASVGGGMPTEDFYWLD